MERKTPPVRKGDIIEVEITSTGSRGDGMTKYNGFVIFVPGANEGDKISVQIRTVRENFAIGDRI